jgi:NAD(P)H-hydrate epimerase
MLPILTPQESVALDRASSERGVSVATLMEKAGRAVARAAATACGGTYGRRAVVVCGKGNNGGDGLVAARYLDRWGMAVTTILLAPSDAFTGAAAASLRRLVETGTRCLPFSGRGLDRELARADVVVDAVFGTGFRGVAEGSLAAAIAAINQGLAAVVAVDIPSGVDGETGSVAGIAVQADTTVALGALKPGVVFHPGAAHAGEVQVADIGFPRDLIRTDLWLAERSDVVGLLRPRGPETHKREVGTVLVVAGSRTMTGAAILAASAAYRAGGGLVTLAVPEGILPIVQSAITEATFLPLPETPEGTISEEAWPLLEERLALAGSAAAAAVGPGLTTHPSTAELVRRLVVASSVPLVLDADGLGAFAGRGALISEHRSELVMTPHAGEFGRLAGLSSEDVTKDRVGHARKAAAEYRSTVLLKGSRTVIAEPAGRAMVNPTGGPYLATGGTGDVLTGAIAAFLARGLAPSDAALLGAYAHGLAGKAAHAELGEGTVASDVSARLPRVLAELARGRPSFAGEA